MGRCAERQAQASKAADFILSFSRKEEEVPVPEDELVTA